MRKLALVLISGLFVAGCEKCTDPALLNAGIGIGSGGTTGGVSVGRTCGPAHVTLGVGNSYYLHW